MLELLYVSILVVGQTYQNRGRPPVSSAATQTRTRLFTGKRHVGSKIDNQYIARCTFLVVFSGFNRHSCFSHFSSKVLMRREQTITTRAPQLLPPYNDQHRRALLSTTKPAPVDHTYATQKRRTASQTLMVTSNPVDVHSALLSRSLLSSYTVRENNYRQHPQTEPPLKIIAMQPLREFSTDSL